MRRLAPTSREPHVFVCHGKRCTANGAPRLRAALSRALRAAGLRPRLTRASCQDHCKRGPVVFVERPSRRVWGAVDEDDVPMIAAKLERALLRERRKREGR